METIYYSIVEKCFISSLVTIILYYVGEQLMEIETPYNEIEMNVKTKLNNNSIKLVEI